MFLDDVQIKGCDSNFEVKRSNFKSLEMKCKRYPSAYCLMQGKCFICSNFEKYLP